MRSPARQQEDTEQACLARLLEMDVALARMAEELPDDARHLGEQARRTVQAWTDRLHAGGADLEALSAALREVAGLMDVLTARLFAGWEPLPGPRDRPS